MNSLARFTPIVVLLCLAPSCADDGAAGEQKEPTGSVCPSGSTLTYENFARPFMEEYCTRCHSSALSGTARNGAPEFHDFDSEAGILAVADHVDERAAAGPESSNNSMPPSGAKPSHEEREQLGEWLACSVHGSHSHEEDGGPHDASAPEAGHLHDAGP